MRNDRSWGNILVFTDDSMSGERLSRWIPATGETPIVLSGAEKFLMGAGDDEAVDLLVTDLDPDDPATEALLERLISGDLFTGIPQLHLFRDMAWRDRLQEKDPGLAAIAMLSPPEAMEFQARVRLASEIGRLRRKFVRSSIRDPMTGLLNRRCLILRLEEEFSRARRYRTPLSLIFFDIDRLKTINDSYGQSTGDSVIRRVAQVIEAQVRKEDVLGRTGEESFGIVLPGNRYRGSGVLANKVRTETEDLLLQFEGESFQVRVSAGISTYPDNHAIRTSDDLVRTAENALAEAKARGGNRIHIDEGVLLHERRVVLVADSDPTLLDLAEDLLALDDYRVVTAETARALLATLRLQKPDLLVLDLRMAEEEGGPPVIGRIQEMFPDTRFPIIGLSPEPDADPEKLLHLGVDRFITKPFSLSLLRSAARELLETIHPITG